MKETFAEQEAVLRKVEWLFREPLIIGKLYDVLGSDERLSEVIDWAVDLHRLLRNARDFCEKCTRKTPGTCLSAQELRRGLRLWHKARNPRIPARDFFRILNESCGLPESNRQWQGLSLVLPGESKLLFSPAARHEFGVECLPEVSVDLTNVELSFLKKIARQRIVNFEIPTKSMRHPFHIVHTGAVENDLGNDLGIGGQIPPRLTVPADAIALISNKELIEDRFDKGTRELKSYQASVANLYVLDEILVNKLSVDDAITGAQVIGYDSSAVDKKEIDRVLVTFKTNGNSKEVGDSLVLVECWIFGRSPEKAILRLHKVGIPTSGKSTFRRLEHFTNVSARSAPSPGSGGKLCA